jgi:hypothetical protein
MKRSLLISFCILVSGMGYAQKFTTEKGHISFYSDAAIEDIEAVNSIVGSLFNANSGELVYIMKIRDFIFHKALMREHFNEKYMESEKFPKATFQGKLLGFKADAQGEQKVKAIGRLTIHGVTHDIEVPGTAEFTNGKLVMKSKFMVKLKDYNIKIPTLVWQNIAEEVLVTIDFIYKPV